MLYNERESMKKLKITLACAGGVSTSMLCNKLIAEGASHGFEVECKAFATSALADVADGSDVILIGPQVSYMEDDLIKKYPNTPIRLMDMRDYGTMNTKKIFADLLEEFKW